MKSAYSAALDDIHSACVDGIHGNLQKMKAKKNQPPPKPSDDDGDEPHQKLKLLEAYGKKRG